MWLKSHPPKIGIHFFSPINPCHQGTISKSRLVSGLKVDPRGRKSTMNEDAFILLKIGGMFHWHITCFAGLTSHDESSFCLPDELYMYTYHDTKVRSRGWSMNPSATLDYWPWYMDASGVFSHFKTYIWQKKNKENTGCELYPTTIHLNISNKQPPSHLP